MATATRSSTISAPIERVWSVLADFAGTYRWNPVVPFSHAVGDRSSGLGARRRFEFNGEGTKWIEEEIIAFDEVQHRYTLQLKRGTEMPPVDDVQVQISADRASPSTTRVTMTATLTGRGPVQKVVAGVGSLALRRVLGQLMAGLDHHVATGREVVDLKQIRRA